MSSFLNKIKVKTAIEDRTKLDLGCDHISTANWMQYNVAYNKEMVPREKLDVNMETFTRLLPLTKPTFGRANVNNRAFFVPYRTIMKGWNDFITDTIHVPSTNDINTDDGQISVNGSLLSSVPYTTNDEIVKLFTDQASQNLSVEVDEQAATADPSSASYEAWDFAKSDVDYMSGFSFWKLTPRGRQALKILNSLGYEIIWNSDDTTAFSMMPLLSVLKIYCDWYFPSEYLDDGDYKKFESMINFDSTTAHKYLAGELLTIFSRICYVCYDSDIFTSAWDNPTGPNQGLYSSLSIANIDNTNIATGVSVNTNGNVYGLRAGSPYVVGDSLIDSLNSEVQQMEEDGMVRTVSQNNFTQFVIDSLKKLTDYMKRHQLVGARAIDRYLARFGITLSSEKTNRSLYLGKYIVPLQIGDVMSTADTKNSQGTGLGNYAGKGIGYGNGHFEYDTEEYGQFVIISSIIPAVGYYQGRDRNTLHVTKTDFWTPEFDSLGSQAISAAEVYTSMDPYHNHATNANSLGQDIFGFAPRYAEYKFAKDRLTGDFRYASKSTGDDAWYLMRNLDPIFGGTDKDSSDIVHGLEFTQSTDSAQYDRIFQTATDEDDKFKVIYHFEIASFAPMKPLFENYDFDGGKDVVVDEGGPKVN